MVTIGVVSWTQSRSSSADIRDSIGGRDARLGGDGVNLGEGSFAFLGELGEFAVMFHYFLGGRWPTELPQEDILGETRATKEYIHRHRPIVTVTFDQFLAMASSLHRRQVIFRPPRFREALVEFSLGVGQHLPRERKRGLLPLRDKSVEGVLLTLQRVVVPIGGNHRRHTSSDFEGVRGFLLDRHEPLSLFRGFGRRGRGRERSRIRTG
jgi:hypothetical protein